MSRRPDIAEVVGMLADRMPELARELCGEPTQRNRDEQRYRRRGSLSVIISGPKRGSWYDHEAGCGGDAAGTTDNGESGAARPPAASPPLCLLEAASAAW